MSRRPNVHPLCLPTEFYLAICDVQSKHRIGKSSAILLMLCEGLRKEEFLDEKIYEIYKARYSTPLMEQVQKSRDEGTKPRCKYIFADGTKCRRIATVTLKKGNKQASSCAEHLREFLEFAYEVVEELR